MSKNLLKGATIGIDDFDGAARLCAMRRGEVISRISLRNSESEMQKALASGLAVAASAPPSATISLSLGKPPIEAAKFERVLPQLLDAHLPMPVSECALACAAYGDPVIAYVIRETDLRSRIGSLSERRVNPARILPLGHCVWNLARSENAAKLSGASRPLIIAVSNENLTLIVAGGGTAPDVQIVCKTNTEEIASRLRLAFAGAPSNPVCVAAGTSAATTADLFKTFSGADVTIPESPEFYTAKALACDAPGAGFFKDTNLRTGVFARDLSEGVSPKPFVAAIAVLGICAAALFAFSHKKLAEAGRVEKQSAVAFEDSIKETAGYKVTSKGARAVDDAIAAAPAQISPDVENYRADRLPDTLTLVRRIIVERGIKLKSFSVSGRGISASGDAPKAEDAEFLAKIISDAGFDAQLAEPPRAVAPGGQFQFMIAPLKK